MGQCIKIKSFRWQQSESCQNVNMKNSYLYCHPMASVIYIEANFPAGNTRMLRTPTNQIEEAGTDIQLDGNNLSICMETLGKSIKYNLFTSNVDFFLSLLHFLVKFARKYFWRKWRLTQNDLILLVERYRLYFLENQRFELEFQNPTVDRERKCFERLGRFSIHYRGGLGSSEPRFDRLRAPSSGK